MDPRTLEQERASFAFKVVSEIKNKQKNIQEKYSSYVGKSPTMILTNGLGATLAFYLSKLKKPINDADYRAINPENYSEPDAIAYAYLYKHISTWLAEGSGDNGVFKGLTGGRDPLKFIMSSPATKVIVLTNEALVILNWMKKFAKAMLEGSDSHEQHEY